MKKLQQELKRIDVRPSEWEYFVKTRPENAEPYPPEEADVDEADEAADDIDV